MVQVLFVGLGGFAGSILRYMLGKIEVSFVGAFPLMTLIINFAGAFLIGVISQLAGNKIKSENMILLLKTGLCGGFTTFSTFSLESMSLIQSGKTILAVAYMSLSVVLCLVAVWLGSMLVRKISI